jgi:hypothetical protein
MVYLSYLSTNGDFYTFKLVSLPSLAIDIVPNTWMLLSSADNITSLQGLVSLAPATLPAGSTFGLTLPTLYRMYALDDGCVADAEAAISHNDILATETHVIYSSQQDPPVSSYPDANAQSAAGASNGWHVPDAESWETKVLELFQGWTGSGQNYGYYHAEWHWTFGGLVAPSYGIQNFGHITNSEAWDVNNGFVWSISSLTPLILYCSTLCPYNPYMYNERWEYGGIFYDEYNGFDLESTWNTTDSPYNKITYDTTGEDLENPVAYDYRAGAAARTFGGMTPSIAVAMAFLLLMMIGGAPPGRPPRKR